MLALYIYVICRHVCIHAYNTYRMHACTYVHVGICIYVCMYIHIYVHTYVCTCIYHIHVYMCILPYMVHVCMYASKETWSTLQSLIVYTNLFHQLWMVGVVQYQKKTSSYGSSHYSDKHRHTCVHTASHTRTYIYTYTYTYIHTRYTYISMHTTDDQG